VTEPDDTTDLDRDYPDIYLECRSLQHRWKLVGYFHAYGEIVRSLTCERCTMDRHDRWSPGGVRLGSSDTQPDGYRIGNGGATAFEVRREVLNRVTIYENEDDMHRTLMAAKGRRTKKKAAS